jgi:hypothetical protein
MLWWYLGVLGGYRVSDYPGFKPEVSAVALQSQCANCPDTYQGKLTARVFLGNPVQTTKRRENAGAKDSSFFKVEVDCKNAIDLGPKPNEPPVVANISGQDAAQVLGYTGTKCIRDEYLKKK